MVNYFKNKKMDYQSSKNSLFQIPETCPNCSQKYSGAKASVISSGKSVIMVHMTCPKCKTSIISNISLNNMGVLAIGMLTDLEKEDLKLLRDENLVTTDDVISIHEYIEEKGCINFSKK